MSARHPFGHIAIAPTPPSRPAFWIGAPREGWTDFCARMMNIPIPLDEVSDREVWIIQRRADVLATLIGLQQGASHAAIRMADVRQRGVWL